MAFRKIMMKITMLMMMVRRMMKKVGLVELEVLSRVVRENVPTPRKGRMLRHPRLPHSLGKVRL